ncbi:MAG: S-methyl-5'-thioadenosine phosphorylase [Rickettsiales bacterium]|nr:S-methyl-5'-thioadenosine phosphorylase [Rickettsiales bacterium]|tara:strand:- start:641 stop:1498 length:858 start_codon:yes stop_codon:yes gene_type:complete
MEKVDIAFIGGSGLYKVPNLKNPKWIDIKCNFGFPSSKICIGNLNGKSVAFLPRHGLDHNISPSNINYRANIEALKIIGVENIISLSAVGSLRDDYNPGDFVVVDQFIDKTYARIKTFFDEDCVVHIPMSSPICKKLKEKVLIVLEKLKINSHSSGTYICIEGPQFSTLAESNLYRSWGCDVIGMTNMPEAKLAKEAGICYSAISMVTDFDCWHPKHDSVTIDQIIETLKKNSETAFCFIDEFCKQTKFVCDDETKNLSKNSIITDIPKIKKGTKKRLKNIIKDL